MISRRVLAAAAASAERHRQTTRSARRRSPGSNSITESMGSAKRSPSSHMSVIPAIVPRTSITTNATGFTRKAPANRHATPVGAANKMSSPARSNHRSSRRTSRPVPSERCSIQASAWSEYTKNKDLFRRQEEYCWARELSKTRVLGLEAGTFSATGCAGATHAPLGIGVWRASIWMALGLTALSPGAALALARCRAASAELPPARIEQPELPPVEPRGVGHGEPFENHLVLFDIDDGSAARPMLPPAIGHVASSDHRDVTGHARLHREPVQMAAVLGGELRNERRLPKRDKTMPLAHRR